MIGSDPSGDCDCARIYLADETAANAATPVLLSAPAELRDTLIARREGKVYRFDFHMQGDREPALF